jgi:hypothetical protein
MSDESECEGRTGEEADDAESALRILRRQWIDAVLREKHWTHSCETTNGQSRAYLRCPNGHHAVGWGEGTPDTSEDDAYYDAHLALKRARRVCDHCIALAVLDVDAVTL